MTSAAVQDHGERVGWDRWDSLLVAVLIVATVVVHPVTSMIHQPYWQDEAWVADLTRLPFGRAFQFSASTPTGWLTLLWLLPGSGLERGRILAATKESL